MMYISDSIIEQIIKEDVPYLDITTLMLGISDEMCKISFISREKGVAACTPVAKKIFEKLGAEVTFSLPNGYVVDKGTIILEAQGKAGLIHMGWKAALNVLEYFSGIATYAYILSSTAKKFNQDVSVASTRKSVPLTKELSIMAITAGKMIPHRLGLSETVLIFKNHTSLLKNNSLENIIKNSTYKADEKKIILEVESVEDALSAINYNFIQALQLDKINPKDTAHIVRVKNLNNPNLTIISAGGINKDNIKEYALTGVNIIATSSIFSAKPLDIKAEIIPI